MKFTSDTHYLALAALLLCTACASLDPFNVIGRQLVGSDGATADTAPGAVAAPLDAAARERAFDFVWNTINESYYDPALNGVDWAGVGRTYRPLALKALDDEAFWDVLDRMTGELKDAHTRVESPKRVALRKLEQAVTLGFSFKPIEGKLAVTRVSVDTDAYWAGVRPGMILVSIGDEPAAVAYQRLIAGTRQDSTERSRHLQAIRRLVWGEEGSGVHFRFQRVDGSEFDANLARTKVSTRPAAMHRILPSGYGYLRLTQWTIGATARAIEGLKAMNEAPGIIIDLRFNPGGSLHAVNAMLSRFFSSKTELGRHLTRTGKPVSLFFGAVDIIKLRSEVDGEKDAYKGPVVILVNDSSGSGSEYFAATLQAKGRAAVVGEPSCGCLLGFLGYARIPGGGELAYSEVGFVMANGRRIEGEGVIPDHAVPLTLVDLQTNRDRALELAQELLPALPAWKQ